MASKPKVFAFEDVSKHDKAKDCWLILYGKVYDMTPFMYEHPGGVEALLSVTGKDATYDFEEIGHSNAAKEILDRHCIGNIDMSTVPKKRAHVAPQEALSSTSKIPEVGIKTLQVLAPVVIMGSALAIRHYTMEK
ncbi:oxidoreductase [Lithospermum erythrorhizon]|uniref:Oxidoreductase n=1 Tax=Lithospermum erythrorhizon TaxID=34254 RepID=A0AAV3PE71_LITER